jgi:hypothetical protein
MAEKRILVQKIPREKAKSALGYVCASLIDSPVWPKSEDAAE